MRQARLTARLTAGARWEHLRLLRRYADSAMSETLDQNTPPLQVFTTAASLLELVDKRVVLTLRDGRILYAVLRSFDTYGNLVLQNTVERIFLPGKFAEANHGVYIIRGENIALVGELDLAKDDHFEQLLTSFQKVDFSEAQREMAEFGDRCEAQLTQEKPKYLSRGFDPTSLGANPYLY